MNATKVGVIGCGYISGAYMQRSPTFASLDLVACADLDPAAARSRADAFGLRAMSVDDLLDDPEIGIVVNLTTPQAHVDVGLNVLAAGKHLHAEKPLATTVAAAAPLLEAAAARPNLRVGSAPDTFLGGGHQTACQLIDAGRIGEIVAGSCHMMLHGHERFHPNPDFYYVAGGGPMLDMGPYYLTCLVNLLGPVKRVTAATSRAFDQRTIEVGPRAGEAIPVEVPTHITGILEFAQGAMVNLTTSFDVWRHQHNHIELYGTEGSMVVPDPNQFGGTVLLCHRREDWQQIAPAQPFADGDYRGIGVADLALAVREDRPHRASLALASHVLEVMEAFEVAAGRGGIVDIASTCERPAALDAATASRWVA